MLSRHDKLSIGGGSWVDGFFFFKNMYTWTLQLPTWPLWRSFHHWKLTWWIKDVVFTFILNDECKSVTNTCQPWSCETNFSRVSYRCVILTEEISIFYWVRIRTIVSTVCSGIVYHMDFDWRSKDRHHESGWLKVIEVFESTRSNKDISSNLFPNDTISTKIHGDLKKKNSKLITYCLWWPHQGSI